MATNLYRKNLKGYTTQARWYAANLESPVTGDWVDAGWTNLVNCPAKPVFKMTDGTLIVILDGATHLDKVITEVQADAVYATEDAAYAAAKETK